ncbi:MAG: hypothetical protein ACFFFK_03625 [Candidatus Thorarchaeota archaeon]
MSQFQENITQEKPEAKKTNTDWFQLLAIGLVLIALAGLDTSVSIWVDYLDYGFIPGGVIALILAVFEFWKQNNSETDTVDHDRSEILTKSRILTILIIVALFTPHAIGISGTRFELIAIFWMLGYLSHSSDSIGFYPANFQVIFLQFLFIFLFVGIITLQRDYMTDKLSKWTVLGALGIALMIHEILLILPPWSVSFGLWIPVPIFYMLNILVVVKQTEFKANEIKNAEATVHSPESGPAHQEQSSRI